MKSINPANNQMIREYAEHSATEVTAILDAVQIEWLKWRLTSYAERRSLLRNAAVVLREKKQQWASLITLEMGKIIREAEAEVEKCATVCDFYADHGEAFLKDSVIASDATRSFIAYQPLGVVLAVMPWNFPFWQVFRFAAPALMAGNAAVLKHASNVPGCALAVEEIFREAGSPADLFRTLMIPSSQVEAVIANPVIRAVTLTGSEQAGSQVAAAAGKHIKKTVLELGGSDPFIVLEDADLEHAISVAVTARMINQGQSCIAAKRFIVTEKVKPAFESGLKKVFEALIMGDPMDPATQVGPLARPDLVDEIDRQVKDSVKEGAVMLCGGERPLREGCYYLPTILTDVTSSMRVFREETFGPVAVIIPAGSEEEAVALANDCRFGLGGSVWTRDIARGERIARNIETGAMFVNGLVKSDPRLPFGGIRKSGYGRELGETGIREFVNAKTIWISEK